MEPTCLWGARDEAERVLADELKLFVMLLGI